MNHRTAARPAQIGMIKRTPDKSNLYEQRRRERDTIKRKNTPAGNSIGDTDDERQQASERHHGGIVGAVDRNSTTVAADGHDLVDHDLRWLTKASCFTRRK